MCIALKTTLMRNKLREDIINGYINNNFPHEVVSYLEPLNDKCIRIVLIKKRKPYELNEEESKQIIEKCNLILFTCSNCKKKWFDTKYTKKDGEQYIDYTKCPDCKKIIYVNRSD
jgi:hypothetical protein